MILNITQISLILTKKQVPAHFRCTKYCKFHFRFSFTAPKDAESILELFGQKWSARTVTVKKSQKWTAFLDEKGRPSLKKGVVF